MISSALFAVLLVSVGFCLGWACRSRLLPWVDPMPDPYQVLSECRLAVISQDGLALVNMTLSMAFCYQESHGFLFEYSGPQGSISRVHVFIPERFITDYEPDQDLID